MLLNINLILFLRKKKNLGTNRNENEANIFLERYNKESSILSTELTRASWNYDTNLTDDNANILVHISIKHIYTYIIT